MKIEDAPPPWLNNFMSQVGLAFSGGLAPSRRLVGWQWSREEDVEDSFEGLVYPNLIEVQSEPCLRDVCIDVQRILSLFESYDDVSLSFNCADEPDADDYLSISGRVAGHDLYLRLLKGPPEDDAVPTSRVHADGSFEDIDEMQVLA